MLVQSEEIENWADSGNAISEFPRLMACLIIGSCPDITDIAMPGGKGVFCGGPDGRVECGGGNAFVPTGSSVWELGTDNHPAQKADTDFAKRLMTIPAGDRSQRTFVFATLRKWPGAQTWRDGLRQQNHWKDVKVITSDQIEKWFELVPWVANDFCREQLKRTGRGPNTLRETWRNYENAPFKSSLQPQFVIAGRKGHSDKLKQWLTSSGQRRVLRFYGSSFEEPRDFLAACVAEMPDAQREFHFPRIVLAEERESAIAIRRLHTDCILFTVEGTHLPVINQAASESGCRIILCCLGSAPNAQPANPEHDVFELTAATNNDLINSVTIRGYSAQAATEICARYNFEYVKIRQELFKC